MKVLIDTSVWIEFINKRLRYDRRLDEIPILMQENRLATIFPIQAELLSGPLTPSKEKIIREAFAVMQQLDLDWNEPKVWYEISELAQSACRKKLKIPGIVDRMIILAAQNSRSLIWTFDRSLKNLAEAFKVPLFEDL